MLTLDRVSKSYTTRAGVVRVLDEVTFDLDRGDAAAITGPPGSGKTTIFSIAGGLEPPDAGSVDVNGSDPYELSVDARAAFRSREVGFVFQDPSLLPRLTVIENVLVPALAADADRDALDRARALLAAVGLDRRHHHRPSQLSAGDQQRVAIARALIRSPSILIGDEPTGNLDAQTAATVVDLLLRLHVQQHATLLVVTGNEDVAARFTRRATLTGGRLVDAALHA